MNDLVQNLRNHRKKLSKRRCLFDLDVQVVHDLDNHAWLSDFNHNFGSLVKHQRLRQSGCPDSFIRKYIAQLRHIRLGLGPYQREVQKGRMPHFVKVAMPKLAMRPQSNFHSVNFSWNCALLPWQIF